MSGRSRNPGDRLAVLLLVALGPMLPALPAQVGGPSAPPAGRALAERYCTACHLLPEPGALTKTAWIHHLQPEMAKWLGVERVDYESLPDGRLLEEARLFPGSPILPEAEWFAIWDYYRSAAPSRPQPQPVHPATQPVLRQFRAHRHNPLTGAPMISLVHIDAASRRLLVADAFAGALMTLDPSGVVVARERFLSPAVSVAIGQRRRYLALIGRIFPSDAEEGALLVLPGSREGGTPRPVLANLRRPTDAVAIDLNQDGREDFAVCQFGNRLGCFSWFENRGDGQYEEHVLVDRPGAVAVRALDLTRDGRPDLLVLTAQAREAVILFINEGAGRFSPTTLLEFPPYWGMAGLDLVDFNKDGFVDLVVANGDNGDFALPTKPYHGVRLYLNDGTNGFHQAFFHPMHGAYKAIARDFDADGDIDLAAIAFYPDFSAADGPSDSFVYLENLGGLKFAPQSAPETRLGRWLTMDAGDLDGDGDDDLVLGSFVKGPTTVPVPMEIRERWRTNGAAVLVLENLRR